VLELMDNGYPRTSFGMIGTSRDPEQAVVWCDVGPDYWEGHLPLPEPEFELLLTVRLGEGNRYLAQIEKVDRTGAAPSEILRRFYPEFLPLLLFEAIQECTDQALEFAAQQA
jgi:hypothetical protein